MTLGRVIRLCRESRGYSQYKLADRMQRCNTLMSRIENDVKNVTDDFLDLFSAALNLSDREIALIQAHRQHKDCLDVLTCRYFIDETLPIDKFSDLVKLNVNDVQIALNEIKENEIRTARTREN